MKTQPIITLYGMKFYSEEEYRIFNEKFKARMDGTEKLKEDTRYSFYQKIKSQLN